MPVVEIPGVAVEEPPMLVSRRDIFDLIIDVINWIGSKSRERLKYLRRNESEQRRANYSY
jgi:hypothetical protein